MSIPSPARSTAPAARRGARLLVRTNLFVTLGVVGLTWFCARSMGVVPGLELLVTGAGTLLVYNLDHLRDDHRRTRALMGRPLLGGWSRGTLLGAAAVLLGAGFVLGPPRMFLAALPSGALGLSYGAALAGRRLKDLPGAKAWIVAFAVTWAVLALPVARSAGRSAVVSPDLVIFVLALTALNAHAFDLRDVHNDEATGTWTWAVRLGPDLARRRMMGATAVLAVLAAIWQGLAHAGLATAQIGPESVLTLSLLLGALAATRFALSREVFSLLFDGLLLVPAVYLLLT